MATASKPPISPICTNDGLSDASDCMVGAGPHVLVLVEDGQPVDVLDRHDRTVKRPSLHAAAARFWLSTA